VYGGRARPVLERLVALQDVLGLHQDAFVAIERLRQLTGERGAELPPPTIFAMGEVAERYRQSIAALRAQVPSSWRRVDGKRWASFHKHIESKRPAPAPEEPAARPNL